MERLDADWVRGQRKLPPAVPWTRSDVVREVDSTVRYLAIPSVTHGITGVGVLRGSQRVPCADLAGYLAALAAEFEARGFAVRPSALPDSLRVEIPQVPTTTAEQPTAVEEPKAPEPSYWSVQRRAATFLLLTTLAVLVVSTAQHVVGDALGFPPPRVVVYWPHIAGYIAIGWMNAMIYRWCSKEAA